MPIPLLLLSDAITAPTGLARITRDLATRIHEHLGDVFEVGTLGYGAPYSRAFPFPQYEMLRENWLVLNLPEVWKDFAGDRKGILFTIWDASRLLWLSRPENCTDPHVRKFIQSNPFGKWGYFPIDAHGPQGKLTAVLKHTISGYNRVLAYSKWAQGILAETEISSTQLPHGIDTSVFYPRNRSAARHGFGARNNLRDPKNPQKFVNPPDDAFMIGIVATNQARKDYGLGIATVAEIAKERKVFLWIHTDVPVREWSILDTLNDFGLLESSVVTAIELSDEQMAWSYSACDCSLAIGLGEGFGYGAAESLACGTPVVAPNYGGGEFIPPEFLVDPVAWRMEGPFSCMRPVMSVRDFAHKAKQVGDAGKLMSGSLLPSAYEWPTLWTRWAEWLKAGVK